LTFFHMIVAIESGVRRYVRDAQCASPTNVTSERDARVCVPYMFIEGVTCCEVSFSLAVAEHREQIVDTLRSSVTEIAVGSGGSNPVRLSPAIFRAFHCVIVALR